MRDHIKHGPPGVAGVSGVHEIKPRILGRDYTVTMTFHFDQDVTPAQLQEALLRAVKTRAFGVPGTVNVSAPEQLEE